MRILLHHILTVNIQYVCQSLVCTMTFYENTLPPQCKNFWRNCKTGPQHAIYQAVQFQEWLWENTKLLKNCKCVKKKKVKTHEFCINWYIFPVFYTSNSWISTFEWPQKCGYDHYCNLRSKKKKKKLSCFSKIITMAYIKWPIWCY